MKIYLNSHVSLDDIAQVYSEYDSAYPTTAHVKTVMVNNIKCIKENMDKLTSYEYELLCLSFDILNLIPTPSGINLVKITHSMLSAICAKLRMRKSMKSFYNKYTNFIRDIKYFTKWNTNEDIRNIDKLLYNRLKTGRFSITFALYDFNSALEHMCESQYRLAYNCILFT